MIDTPGGCSRCCRSSVRGTMLHDDINQLFCLVCTIASKLNCIPFDYNCRTQSLTVVKSRWRRWMWHASVFILFAYARFLFIRLFQTAAHLNRNEDSVEFTISHVILLLFFLAFLLPTAFQINIWIKQDEIVHAFNQVISASRKQRRRWSAPTSGTAYDQIKLIFLPASCYIGSLIMLCVFIVRPEGDQFLFSIIPRHYQRWWAFLIFLMVETFAAISVATTIMFQHVIQVVMMQSCSSILLQNCAQTPIDIGEFSRMIQSYQVQHFIVTQFNRCFAWNLQVFKMVSITIAVASNFMLIRSRHYLDAFSITFIGVCAIVFPPLPILLYDQVFRINDFSQTFKSRMEVGLRFLKYQSNRRYFAMKIKSLPALNIRSGEFYLLNRTETLMYIYLITIYTTKLLVAI